MRREWTWIDKDARSHTMNSPEPASNLSQIDLAHVARSKKWFGWAAFVCGVIMVAPPMIGIVDTILEMVRAFSTLHKTGGADPSELAGHISVALLTTFWASVFSALALIPFIVFLALFLKQRKILMRSSRRD